MKELEKEEIIKEFKEVYDNNKYPFIDKDEVNNRLFLSVVWAARKTTKGDTAKALEKINENRKELNKVPIEKRKDINWVQKQIDKLMY